MASAYITTRRTKTGLRFLVRYRVGGRETPARHAGSFKTVTEAEAWRDRISAQIAAGNFEHGPKVRGSLIGQPQVEIAEPTSVYVARDATGHVLYVGITGLGMRRLKTHSSSSAWWERVSSIEIEHFARRSEAQARESQLIRERDPEFNVVGRVEATA